MQGRFRSRSPSPRALEARPDTDWSAAFAPAPARHIPPNHPGSSDEDDANDAAGSDGGGSDAGTDDTASSTASGTHRARPAAARARPAGPGQDPAPPDDGAAARPPPPREKTVRAPFVRFTHKGVTFVVLPDSDARAGPLTNVRYLTPYVVEPEGEREYASPYPPTDAANAKEVRVAATDGVPAPHPRRSVPGVHYLAPAAAGYMEVGALALTPALERAERLDWLFAKRMEGLTNVAATVCWDCLDPDFNPADRQPVLQQFMAKYLDRYYSKVGLTGDAEATLAEGLRRHKEFCKEWVRQHYKSLTPYLFGPAEVLANSFHRGLSPHFAQGRALTCPELARLLIRHEKTTVEFAYCLQFFTASIEQSRGNRNASYKQMATVTSARNTEVRNLGEALSRNLSTLHEAFKASKDDHGWYFGELTVDWYDILGQMPQAHRAFDDLAAFGVPGQRDLRSSRDHEPPWRVGRS